MDSVADYICWKKVSKLDRAVEFKQEKMKSWIMKFVGQNQADYM